MHIFKGAGWVRRDILFAKKLKKTQGGVVLFQDVHLRVLPGQSVGIVSTDPTAARGLFAALSGKDATVLGKVYVRGRCLAQLSHAAKSNLLAKNIGILQVEDPSLDLSQSAMESVMGPLFLADTCTDLLRAADETLRMVGFDGDVHQKLIHLTKSQRLLVALARCVVHQPAIALVFWHPVSPHPVQQEVLSLLHDYGQKMGMARLVITTQESAIQGVQRRFVLKNTRCIATAD